jgi:hypothetical protein
VSHGRKFRSVIRHPRLTRAPPPHLGNWLNAGRSSAAEKRHAGAKRSMMSGFLQRPDIASYQRLIRKVPTKMCSGAVHRIAG